AVPIDDVPPAIAPDEAELGLPVVPSEAEKRIELAVAVEHRDVDRGRRCGTAEAAFGEHAAADVDERGAARLIRLVGFRPGGWDESVAPDVHADDLASVEVLGPEGRNREEPCRGVPESALDVGGPVRERGLGHPNPRTDLGG